jgi:drug/metabolite transporter (DMT)-like permease
VRVRHAAFGIGLGNTRLTQVGSSVGTGRAGAAVAAVLLNSSPFFVAVLARFVLADPITRLRAAGLVIGFRGCCSSSLEIPAISPTGGGW